MKGEQNFFSTDREQAPKSLSILSWLLALV